MWIRTDKLLLPENQPVKTKIDDENGIRNEQVLMLYHTLWFTPDFEMYVYYIPTHWWQDIPMPRIIEGL